MTGPLSLPPACVLYVDGARFADGQPGELDTEPVALTDLRVVWGRENSVDQPGPATCSFRVLDVGGGTRFDAVLTVGSRVEVRADAVLYPDPTLSTFLDPGFESAAVGSTPSTISTNATVTVTDQPVHTGTRAARVRPTRADRLVRVIFPPAPLSATNDPAAWDTIPRTLPGTTWSYGAAVRVPTGLFPAAAVRVRPVLFTAPWNATGTVTVLDDVADPGTVDGAGWRVDTGTLVPPADRWVGIAVDVFPTGPRWNQVPAGLAWDDVDPTLTWYALADVFVDDLSVSAPEAGAARVGAVFSGRITDLQAQFDQDVGGTIVNVTAQDDTAELGNRYAGDTPWGAESLGTRFLRIMQASGQAMGWQIDPGAVNQTVTWRDVDNQPALSLVQELAQSVAGVLWSAHSLTTGSYLYLEDVNARPALLSLSLDGDGVIRIHPSPVVDARGINLSACSVLLDPTIWRQDGTDTATRVTVGWKEQTVVDGQQRPTDRDVVVIDAAAEVAGGRREVSNATQLTTEAAARGIADSLMARLSARSWRVSGLTWRAELADELDADTLAAVMSILDGTTRLGLPIMLTDLPDWSPIPAGDTVPLFLEGSVLTNTAGAWVLELVVSSAYGQGSSARWSDLPAGAWRWNQFDPAITWLALRGADVDV